ncbi:acetyl-CoA carboxylase biotin carboxyl carrier protein subunit, partial [Microbacterium sp.]|uniref:acetyl-CoA carboxylase biotin carboxyl carrier protein subunit n=1 Tax=Microbacterium sp. TaxID=51671 RepID=UPI003A86BAD4
GRAGWAGPLWRAGTGWRAGARTAPVPVFAETGEGSLVEADAADAAADPSIRTALADDGRVWVHTRAGTWALRPRTRRDAMGHRRAATGSPESTTDPDLRAPLPGTVVAVHVTDGAAVTAGQRLVTIEAMKMEHPITAPHDGLARVAVATGAQVRRDEIVAHVSPEPTSPH